MEFSPFAIDILGIFDSEAFNTLCKLSSTYAQRHGMTFAHARTIFTRRLSFALFRSLAIQLLNLPSLFDNDPSDLNLFMDSTDTHSI